MSTPDTAPDPADSKTSGIGDRSDPAPLAPGPTPTVPTSASAPVGSGGVWSATSASGRLRNGELGRMVAAFLVDHPGGEFTPGQIARALDRSSGAVGNALGRLARADAAEQTSDKPVRYRSTSDTAAAAVGAATPGPGSGTRAGQSARRSRAASPTPAGPAGPTPHPSGAATTTATTTATAVAGTTGANEPVTGPVRRPNGQMYHPRALSGLVGLSDVGALRKLRAAGVPALLYGPPGTGKTSVVEAAFPDLVTVQGDGDTTVADLVGEYTQTPDGRYLFVHGPVVTAMREGRVLFIDDATLIPPTVLAVVYPAMDGRREIVIKANGGEVVRAAEGFYVVAGRNPGVHGEVLTDALSSRFSAQIQVSTDYALAEQLKIDRRAVRVARNLAHRHKSGEISWVPQLRELIAYQRIAEVLGEKAAAGNLVGIAPEEDRDTVAATVRSVFGDHLDPLSLGARFTP